MQIKQLIARLALGETRNSQETLTFGQSGHAVAIFRPHGSATCRAAEAFRRRFAKAAERGTPIVVDLSAVSRMDSAFLAVLVEGKKLAQSQGRSFQVRGADGRTRALIDMARLGPVFDLGLEAPELSMAA